MKLKEFSYEITSDPSFRDNENAITPELKRELEPLYYQIQEQKGSDKIIAKILKLIEKHPKNPQLKNYLTVAYKLSGNMDKAREANQWILSEHPDYLFAKLNLAAEYYENGEYEKMTELLGKMMEIQDLYPDRNTFHFTEVTGFNRFAVMYFCAVGNLEAAESRYEILERVAPDQPDTVETLKHLVFARLEAGKKRWEEEDLTKIKVKTPSDIKVRQSTEIPDFTHEEINLLYQEGLRIREKSLQKILSLSRETLIQDLEMVIRDMLTRYDYFKTYLESNEWNEETMSFGIHALHLLGELRAQQSLDTILNLLRQGEEFLDFWFGDFITAISGSPYTTLQVNRLRN
nr:hypothetical protein [Bacteroidota bacterium]